MTMQMTLQETINQIFLPRLLMEAQKIHPNASIETKPYQSGLDIIMHDGKGDNATYNVFLTPLGLEWVRVY